MYNTSKLTSASDCDVLLTLVNKVKSDLEFEALKVARETTELEENSASLESAITSTNNDLSAVITSISATEDGPDKESLVTKKMRLELKQRVLNERIDNYGAIALLLAENVEIRKQKEVLEMDEIITAVQARKAELTA